MKININKIVMKLIPLSDFILEQKETSTIDTAQIDWYDKEIFKLDLIRSYTKFLKQPLALGMFVPVDVQGNILNEPFYDPSNEQYWAAERFAYDTAKEKVLFEGCEVKEIKTDKNYFVVYHNSRQIWISWTDRIIEDMILNRIYLNGLELTPSALEAIGIK